LQHIQEFALEQDHPEGLQPMERILPGAGGKCEEVLLWADLYLPVPVSPVLFRADKVDE